MTIYTKGQSNRLSIGISIDSKEIYHRAEFLGRKNGYYFRGTLRKVYQLGSGKKTDQFPIAGFWFQDEIEFGKRDVYEKLRSKYETMSFSRMSAIYFTARRSHHALRFDGTFYGNGLPEQAWTNDIPFLFIEFETCRDFEKILSVEITDDVVVNKNPLTSKISLTIKNKSLWWIDVDSKLDEHDGPIFLEAFPPNAQVQREVFLQKTQSLQISFFGAAGRTRLMNTANVIWVGSVGISANDINGFLSELASKFGEATLSYLEKRPELVLQFMARREIIPPQITLEQFLKLQSYLGRAANALMIVGLLLTAEGQIRGFTEWNIITRKQTCTLRAH